MLTKVFALIVSVFSLIASFFGGLIGLSGMTNPALAGSARFIDTYHVGAPLKVTLPADAHPVDAENLGKVRTGTWISTQRPTTTAISFESLGDVDTTGIKEELNNQLPADLQLITGVTGCNSGYRFVWFDNATLRMSTTGMHTDKACSPLDNARQKELLSFLEARPVAHLDAQGTLYLVRPDGVATSFARR
ncbi:MAG: hypothetical protein Q4A31_10340 [Corynebacterium sp.]|uniref:hypothetical protein n=1 Tax=Corynebacterium sp. TaxID=1720 RepID=UPI0026DC1578|nr:hypothetical protein [Corynebacterium sp.]MDO4762307.1 hypothetical protein [Corynebacterium sp.]